MSKTKPGATDFRAVREEFALSQPELASLLAVSPRTVQSCEQGWRKPSASLERSLLLLVISWRQGDALSDQVCWKIKGCPPDRCAQCIAYQTRQGHLCWFLTGTKCEGKRLRNWEAKRRLCQQCSFFRALLRSTSRTTGKSGPRPPLRTGSGSRGRRG